MAEQPKHTRPYYGNQITPGRTGPHPDQLVDRFGAALRAAVNVMERDLIPAGIWKHVSVKTMCDAVMAALAAADAADQQANEDAEDHG